MKAFDKRKVPGLEDFSSDSNDEDDIPLKKTCKTDDIEIELEVQYNEFLREEPVNKGHNNSRRFNNVWGNVIQENILDESFNKVGVNQMSVRRNVESYSIGDDNYSRKRKHGRKINNELNTDQKFVSVKERIESRSYDRNKDRSHIQLNLNSDSLQQIASKIAGLLNERKIELIEKCLVVLGKEKFIQFYYMTEDIEDNGGLLVVNGTRRRTAGGVFLSLIKESDDVDEESKRIIFQNNCDKSIETSKPSIMSAKFIVEDAPMVNDKEMSGLSANVAMDQSDAINNDDELEDGEIV